MNFVVIFGPPAVGKMSVGHELAMELTESGSHKKPKSRTRQCADVSDPFYQKFARFASTRGARRKFF
jgi:hypothetical protein